MNIVVKWGMMAVAINNSVIEMYIHELAMCFCFPSYRKMSHHQLELVCLLPV